MGERKDTLIACPSMVAMCFCKNLCIGTNASVFLTQVETATHTAGTIKET